MCGIVGWSSSKKELPKTALQAATLALAHRGPEAQGIYINTKNTVGFGHRRLKVIDVSDASAQPFHSKCGRYVLIYNGEIYNYKAIAKQLDLQTHTSGDTEVIIEAYAKMGTKAFELLHGIFAFAIYDTQEDKMVLCRDRSGIKPLYYYYQNQQLIFASEIKAIKEFPDINLSINPAAFAEFLHIGFNTEPFTAYKNIYKFPAGNFAVIDVKKIGSESKLDFVKYWSIQDKILPETYKNEAEVEKKLEELLINSIESQMISDVPLGTFLSGGIDSSLITVLASKINKSKIKTFSIGHDIKKFDESVFAAKVAATIGTEHYEYKMNADNLNEVLHDIINCYDEPFFDSSAFPTMLISKYAKKEVTVTLSGDGGDELFMGYGMHQWASRLENPMVRLFRHPFYWGSQFLNFKFKRAGWLLNYSDHNHVTSHIFSQEQYLFSEKELQHYLVNTDFNFDKINQLVKTNRTLTPKEKQSIWDVQNYLKDDLLVKIDRATMRYSLESRVPFLDNNILDYALNIDTQLKFRNGESKYILKKILYKHLPEDLFKRPKQGFAIPLASYLRKEFKHLVDKYLSPIVVNRYDIVANLYVQELKNRFFAGEEYLYARVWVLVILHWWLEENA